ncbi:uncharacterized protein LOC115983444 [Quercus lobata]|uniref:uncharacterized protein LOC115983444 n=1 Tax=Quercus lobata TaxID=97700 RepID=UPI0012490F04|nr:uncharacterized protein LOC115983444 [Quercus lobata]
MPLLNSCNCPWVCIRDFNFTTSDNEVLSGFKGGGSSSTNYLKDLIYEFGAVDLGFSGNKYTWVRGQWGSSAIKRKLDKEIASISWRLTFPKASVTHLGAINSDHTPILLDINLDDSFAHKPFRFEAAWVRDNGCNTVVEKAWNEVSRGSALVNFCKKQAATRSALQKWNKEVFGHCQDKINGLMERISDIEKNPPSEDNGRDEEAL